MSTHHVNTGTCPKCLEIRDRFPGFHAGLWAWFTALQAKNPEAHVSCCGRGKADQEDAFRKGASRAHWEQSAHNWNVALDIFKLHDNGAEWPRDWFRNVIMTAVANHNASPDKAFSIEWYGAPGAKFFELPHCQVAAWHDLRDAGSITLVE